MGMRIQNHPILEFPERKPVRFFYEGKPMVGREGDTIASALHANGISVLSRSVKDNRPRGFYCAIGNCGSCQMRVDGVNNVRTCITELTPGMQIERQRGLADDQT